MAKILFSHSYFYRFDSKQWRLQEPYPPLMTITAAALLRGNGFEVALFDVGLRESPQELESVLHREQPDYFVIFDDGFNYLTKMCLTTMREAAFVMQGMASDYGAKVVTCSSDSTDHYQKYLDHKADFVIMGEGEQVLLKLLQQLQSNESIENLPGIAFVKDGEVKVNPRHPVMKELDALPTAAWDLVDVEVYKDIWKAKKVTPYLNLATTRGCPYKCNWCAKPIYGNRYNSRSAKLAVDEIEYHVQHHGVDHFWMCDDIFGLKPGWVQEFRDELQRRNISIKYKIQSRADLLLQEDNLDALVASGADEVWIGAESGSQAILDAMDKGITIDQIARATTLLKARGVKVAFFIQYGYPGETFQDIKKTLKMVRKLLPDSMGISVSYPLPGTPFYERVRGELGSKANWVDSDDLDLMFKNTYSSQFYRTLHAYTHRAIGVENGFKSLQKMITHPWAIDKRQMKSTLRAIYHLPKLFTTWKTLKRLATI